MPRDVLSRDDAVDRGGLISDVSYRIDLDLSPGAEAYEGATTVRFAMSSPKDTFLEFVGGEITSFVVNGHEVAAEWDGTRIGLSGDLLAAQNEVSLTYRNDYDHSGEGFHQFFDPEDKAEYLYTQFEPYSAHRMFPCFDQPDIKATYEMSITAPAEWAVITASRVVDEEKHDDGRVTRTFERTKPFSPYLVSVIAGDYVGVTDEHNGLPLGIYTRKTLLEHVDADDIFAVTKQGLDYFADLFGTPYPFTKYDQIFVPEFNWGGMENVAAVTYVDALIFRDPPTRDQVIRRDEILLHELAHMWFGNLVTMRWWDDLWLNETFATYAAYLAMEDSGRWDDVWQDFNTRNKVVAYRDDQQPTTHPIATEVADTDEVFLNFDMVTYGKGASVMRQLVATIGLDGFAAGLKKYFARYAFDNTTLADFLGALEEGSGVELAGWAAKWLKTSNVNTLAASVEHDGDQVHRLTVAQSAPDDHPHIRPHRVDIGLVRKTEAGIHTEVLPVNIEDAQVVVDAAQGLDVPHLIFPNHGDLTYTKVALDSQSIDFVKESLTDLDDALLRHQLWQSLWEMVRDRQLPSTEYLDLLETHLPNERSELIVNLVLRTAAGALARYVPEDMKQEQIDAFVATCRSALDEAPPGDLRVLWTRSLVGAASSPEHLAMAGDIVDGTTPIDGLTIDQEMRWEVAVRWAAHAVDGAAERVDAELDRDPSDRGQRAALRAKVSQPDVAIKQEAWDTIHAQGYDSLYYMQSAMAGFRWWVQRELLAPFADGFFDQVEHVVDTWEWEAAKAYFYGLYPGYLVNDRVLGQAQRIAEVADPRLRRLGIEAVDDLERALACRRLVTDGVGSGS